MGRAAVALVAALAANASVAGCLGTEQAPTFEELSADGIVVAVTPERGTVDTPFTFDASETLGADAITFDWDFGDGETGTGPVVEHRFRFDNNLYRVGVTATMADGAISAILEVPVGTGVNAAPTVAVHAGARWVGHGDVLAVHAEAVDSDGDALTIEWLLAKNVGEGGDGHQHEPGEEHGTGAGASGGGFGIPEPTGKTGESAEFKFDESGTYRITARALDPKGGRAEGRADVKVTQTVPKTTYSIVETGTLHAGTGGEASASETLYGLMQPSENTYIDSAHYEFQLFYAGSGTLNLTWNGTGGSAPADLDLYVSDDGGTVILELATRDAMQTQESAEIALAPGAYTIVVEAVAGAEVPFTLALYLDLVVPGLNDVPHDDGHVH